MIVGVPAGKKETGSSGQNSVELIRLEKRYMSVFFLSDSTVNEVQMGIKRSFKVS